MNTIIIIILIIFILYLVFLYYDEMINRRVYFEAIQNILPINEGKMIDVGAGKGILSDKFRNNFDVKQIDISKTGPNVEIYDGYNIPANDNEYNIALSMFVLHHLPHKEEIIQEMKRVADYIIILEDEPNNIISKLFFNGHYFWFDQPMNDDLYANEDEYKDIFERNGLQIIEEHDINGSILYPVKHKIYLLK